MTAFVALVLGALALPQQQAAVTVRATLSDNRIAVGETTMLEIVIETGGVRADRFELPSLPAELDVISTREYLQTSIAVPGGRRVESTRQYVLRPRREGTYVIPPVTVSFGRGVIRRTDALTLTVEAGTGPAPPPAFDQAGRSTDGAVLVTTIEPDTVWLGEPALLRMTALIPEEQETRRRSRAPSFEPPTVQGFWVEELEDRSAVGTRMRDNRYMDLHEYRRMYVPLTSGVHVFSPGRVVYEIGRGWLFSPETRELHGDTVRLHVRPLPTAGRPESFTGAVGRLEVRARVEPVELAPGDAATLIVEIEGQGHIKALPPPRLPPIEGFEVYPPTEDATFSARTTGITGVKTLRWILVAERAGTIELPQLAYAWFDPEAGTYRETTLELHDITVRRVAAGAADTDTALAPLRRSPGGPSAVSWASTPWFAMLQGIPLVLLALAWWWRVRGPRVQARRQAGRARKHRLEQVRARAASDPRAALGELEHVLSDAIAAMLPAGGFGPLVERLRYAGVPHETVVAYEALRADLAQARFQPAAVSEAQVHELLTRAESLLRALVGALERGRTAGVPALLLLALVQAPAADDSFARGVTAFENGAFDHARSAFTTHIETRPDAASAWYNLGNTELRRGRRGAAIQAWAHTLTLEPRAADARANLRAVGAQEIATAAVRPLPLTAHELRALAGMAWIVAGFLLAWAITIRGVRGRRIGMAGMAGVVVCGVALLALAARTSWPQHAVAVRHTAVRTGPALRADERASLQEGELARILEMRGEWALVRGRDGDGWVERRELGLF